MRDPRLCPLLLAAAGAALLGGPSAMAAAAARPAPHSILAECLEDAEIGAGERTALSETASAFVGDLLAGRTPEAYARLGTAQQAKVSAKQFAAAGAALQRGGPFSGLHQEHVYLIQTRGPLPSMVCGQPKTLDGWVRVRTSAAPKQAYVLFAAHAKSSDLAINLRLEPEAGKWRVLDFAVAGSAFGGRTAKDFLALARTQAAAGHAFNATMLLATARSLAQRGPNLEWGFAEEIQRAMAASKAPPELVGKPPYSWKLGATTFDVASVSATGAGGKFLLVLQQKLPAWPDDATAERQNRALIEALLKSRPEVREVFDGILGEAIKPEGTGGLGTVYDMREGFRGPGAGAAKAPS
jgi:hypothetical protein